MVADRVEVVTRRAGEDKATRWESTGGESFEIADDNRFFRGTTVTLHLKPVDSEHGIEDYTDAAVLERIVKRHSDFIALSHPLELTEGAQETLNSMKPMWTRPESEVKDEEYAELYHHISHDWSEPLDGSRSRPKGAAPSTRRCSSSRRRRRSTSTTASSASACSSTSGAS